MTGRDPLDFTLFLFLIESFLKGMTLGRVSHDLGEGGISRTHTPILPSGAPIRR